ncbi:unnamed protein product, partial [Oppiella nova]
MSLYFYIIYAKYFVSDRFYDKRVVEVCDEKWCMVHKYEARNRWHNYRYPNTTFHEFHITIYRYSIAHLSSKYLKPIRNVQQTSYLLHPIVGYYLMDIFPIIRLVDEKIKIYLRTLHCPPQPLWRTVPFGGPLEDCSHEWRTSGNAIRTRAYTMRVYFAMHR